MQQNAVETGFTNAGTAQWIPPTTTFASPPASPATGTLFLFTDASATGANTGGGSSLSQCRWSGSAWVATSGTGGGGGVSSVFGRTGAIVASAGDYTAAQVTNAVDQTGSYANPTWITSLAWSKITGAPATGVNSVFGRAGAVVAVAGDYTAAQVTNAVSTLGSYADPAWITSLAWSKITGTPSVSSYQTPWLSNINAASFNLNNVTGIGIGTSAVATYAIYATINNTANITAIFQNTNTAGAGAVTVGNDGSHSGSILCAGSTYANAAWRNNTVINTGTTDSLILATNSIERVTITAAGNVGVGNKAAVLPSPDSGVHVIIGNTTSGVSNSNLTIAANSSGSFSMNLPFANYARTGSDKRVAQISAQYDGSLDSALLSFFTWNAGVVGERMRITAPGYTSFMPVATEGGEIHIQDFDNGGAWVLDGDATRNIRFYRYLTSTIIFELDNGGAIKMYLGGSLKTLSVDGSGFVKAT